MVVILSNNILNGFSHIFYCFSKVTALPLEFRCFKTSMSNNDWGI